MSSKVHLSNVGLMNCIKYGFLSSRMPFEGIKPNLWPSRNVSVAFKSISANSIIEKRFVQSPFANDPEYALLTTPLDVS